MRIGLDFDNTIVCYDRAIARLADDLFDLPPDLPRTKLALRGFLRHTNRESEWTVFQGALYGPGMAYAEPFEHALETIQTLRDAGHSLCIVSHRSRRPYAGYPYDLHAAARGWVEERLANIGLIKNEMAHFHETREQKIVAVRDMHCEAFLDDLPEVLEDDNFPSACRAILFDPESSYIQSKCVRVECWSAIPHLLADQP
ncbi:MAG: hypothetical protein EBZ48_09115 [Proteobacteria bacterium]|nr:hypothetical protein [Pseudomonadota bacterium]